MGRLEPGASPSVLSFVKPLLSTWENTIKGGPSSKALNVILAHGPAGLRHLSEMKGKRDASQKKRIEKELKTTRTTKTGYCFERFFQNPVFPVTDTATVITTHIVLA